MQTKFDKMRAHRERWVAQPIKAQEAAPQVPVMVVDGVAYVEKLGQSGCTGCAFRGRGIEVCSEVSLVAFTAFGGDCGSSRAIYIKAE